MTLYHYTECGLDNVYVDGVTVSTDAAGEETVHIPRVRKLHKAIAKAIVLQPSCMDGKELRFLRTQMGYTQAELAAVVHHDHQSIGRWERNSTRISQTADTVIRRLAIEKLELGLDLEIDQIAARCVSAQVPQRIVIPMNADGDPQPTALDDAA